MQPTWFLPALCLSLAAQRPVPLEAPIQRVRLHPDEAWVTRVGTAHLPGAGTHKITLANLPPSLRLEDCQVRAQGAPGLRLGDLAVASDVRVVQETPEWKALEAEKDGLRERRDGLEAQSEAAQQELVYLKALQAAYDKEVSSRLTAGAAGSTAALDLGKGIQTRMAELLTAERKRRRDLERLAKEESRVEAELRKRAGEQRTAPSRVTVELTSPGEGAAEIELSYRQRNAQWRPSYEARLSEDRKRLDLVLTAAIIQRTGEPWEHARLEISNARPSLSLAIPMFTQGEAVTWAKEERSRVKAESVYSQQVQLNFMPQERMKQMASGHAGPSPAAAPSPAPEPAREITATVIQEASGLAATFALDGKKDVPSDGEPHRFRVASVAVEPAITLFATPRLDPKAFLMARFEAPQGIPLFPGATVVRYAGMQRLGEAPMVLPPAGQPFALGFGPYKGVRVTFRRVELKQEEVGTFTKERQWTLRERIDLAHDGNEAMDVEVQDRILTSGDERVKLTLLNDFTPNWSEPVPGVRSWKFKMEPKGQKRLDLALTLRAPKDGVVEGITLD